MITRLGLGPRKLSVPAVVVTLLGVVLLLGTATISLSMYQQNRQIASRVKDTQAIVDANVRTLSQSQRELLRLQYLLGTGAPRGRVLLQADFVTQRAHESALSYQEKTLGTWALLSVARDDERHWRTVVLPLVRRATSGGTGAERARARALDEVARLERSYNTLVSQGEINRRDMAGESNADTRTMLQRSRWLLMGMVLTFSLASVVIGIGAAVIIRTDRRRVAAARALLAANLELQRYAQIVRATESMVVVTDPAGLIEWVNEAFEKTTGHRLEEVVGRKPGSFLQGPATDAATVERLREAVRRGEPLRVELANYSASGEEYWVALDVSPLRSATGELTGFVGVESDVTERHEAELLLERAREAAEESAREKAGFLATMSHEIRTPLNAVLGLTDLLLLTDLDEEQREYLETSERSGQHLLALVNDILDYSALEAGRLERSEEPFSPTTLVTEVVEMFRGDADKRGIELRLDLDGPLPPLVAGDPTQVRQVLVNLVGNALKFTEEGSVAVHVRQEPGVGEDDVRPLLVTIRDTGIGVPRWQIPLLFRSFSRGDVSTTRRFGGTGLGLAICRRLVEGMGGGIELTSEVGEGTCVQVVLPLPALDGELPATTAAAVGERDLSHLRVLVAEDDPVNQTVVTAMLARWGIVPDLAGNGQLAVEACREAAYDLVLMDVQMPVMDGLTAVAHVRASHVGEQPWIVALTANALRGDRERFLEAGMDDYISKPVSIDALRSALDRSTQPRPEALPARAG